MGDKISKDALVLLGEEWVLQVIKWLPSLLAAIAVLTIGFWLVNRIIKLIDQFLKARRVEHTLRGFLESFLSALMKFFVVIGAVSFLGVKTASLVALLGAAGLAIGLALQGSLANFAGGMLILFFKPFKAGDYIKAQDKEGFVEKIMIFNTVLKTHTHEMVVIPNGDLANGVVQNLTSKQTRRLDITLGVGYDTDIDEMRAVVKEVINADERILNLPEPEVLISGHGDSAVEVLVRVWVQAHDYWPVNFYLWEATKKAFDKNGISIPFPQRDVHIIKSGDED